MAKLVDMAGAKIGWWTVVERAPSVRNRPARWKCVCSCGRTADVLGSSLRRGTSSMCHACASKMTWRRNNDSQESLSKLLAHPGLANIIACAEADHESWADNELHGAEDWPGEARERREAYELLLEVLRGHR